MLLHAPGDPAQRADTWRALEACLAEGLVANIGVRCVGRGGQAVRVLLLLLLRARMLTTHALAHT